MLPRVNLVRCDQADYLLFSTNDFISTSLSLNGEWAKHFRTISKMFYQDIDAPLILDIGANLGAYCVPIAKDIANVGGEIYAYEPQRIVFYQLCGNLFLNRLDNVFAFCAAIGDHNGFLQLPSIDYKNSKNIGGFSINEEFRDKTGHVDTVKDRREIETPILKLDDISLPRAPCLIKIDVEGSELQVLAGGTALLKRFDYPPILLEAWTVAWFADERKKLLKFLGDLGYEIFTMGDDVIAQHPKYHRHIEFNITDNAIHMKRVT